MIFSELNLPRLRNVDTPAVRTAVRLLGMVILFCVFLGATSHGSDAQGHGEYAKNPSDAIIVETHAPGPAKTEDKLAAEKLEIAKLTAVGLEMWKIGDINSAERAFGSVLNMSVSAELKRPLLLQLEELYQEAGANLKVIAILEKYVAVFPEDPELPNYLMRLGLLYREQGAYEMATARFFQILNATMRSPTDELDSHRRLAMKARLEIAETFDARGLPNEARKYYSHLQVLDLDPADRERVHFRGAELQYELKQWEPAAAELAKFLETYPESDHALEARYLYAKSLHQLGRTEEAVREVVAVLQSQQDTDDLEKAQKAAYWQRRTGNELANKLYERGDFIGALAVYQALARASEKPAWRWPAVYQVGLCFERLNHPERAAEAYRLILAPESAPADDTELSESLESVRSMAEWRLEHLDWIEDYGKRLQILMAENTAIQ